MSVTNTDCQAVVGSGIAGYLTPVSDLGTKEVVPPLQSFALTYGEAAGKVTEMAYFKGSAAGAPVSIDLTALLDAAGQTVNLARVKAIEFVNFNTDGHSYYVDGSVTNGWKALTNGAAAGVTVPSGATWTAPSGQSVTAPGRVSFSTPDATAFAVSGTSKVVSINPGANTVSYGIRLWGNQS